MNKTLYVGNLGKNITENDLQVLFTEAGPVISVNIPTDPRTGMNKKFGFVEMETAEGAQAAIKLINRRILHERELTVNESRERKQAELSD